MATKSENIPLDKAHFDNISNEWTDFKEQITSASAKKLLAFLTNNGLLQVSTFAEYAIAAASGNTVVSEDTHDISDGSDVKLSSVRFSRYGTLYGAPITNITGKTGTLRVQVYERINNKFYYFAIPRAAYSHITKSSNIEIPFHTDGTPRRKPGSSYVIQNWWNYECDTFKEMATKQPTKTTSHMTNECKKRYVDEHIRIQQLTKLTEKGN